MATTLLEISRAASMDLLGRDINIAVYRQKLDRMALELEQRLQNVSSPEKMMQIMSQYFYHDLGFNTDASDTVGQDPRNLLFNDVLDRKKGYCLTLSLPYLCMAEKLQLPLYGVPAPGHFFVRFDSRGTQIDIETTD
ncbi:MAG: hypothetical protein D6814_07635, partial [Calditrichaeota bacterium]